MSVIVQKYGGSSVATLEKIEQIAENIIEHKKRGIDPVVVVSAMGNTTDKLLEMAYSISDNPARRELDMLASSGEQISISLLSISLKKRGYDSLSLTGFQAGIITEGIHTKNRIKDINIERVKKSLQSGKIVVVAGFQGINENGDITTLGRGGSDTSAVALAAMLDCDCEIYTDVEGVYTIDPSYHPAAKKLDYISYEEMLEMSSLGANVFETRAVDLARKYNVSIYLASSHKNISGTYIKESDLNVEEKSVTGVTVSEDVLMVTVNHVSYSSKNIALIFKKLADEDINIDMISQTPPDDGSVNISFTTTRGDLSAVEDVLKRIKEELTMIEVLKDKDVVKISVIGIGMRKQSGVASRVFEIFEENKIEFKQVTTSEISISYTVSDQDQVRAVKALAEEYNL